MALKRLSIEEMVSITSTWVTEGHADREALAAVPAAAALLPAVDTAHRQLIEAHLPGVSPGRLGEIQQAQKALDERHDEVLRGVWHRITAEMHLTRDAQQKAALARLRDTLLPEGLKATLKSYEQEAGQAELMGARLTAADRALLARMTTSDGTLANAIDEWRELAARLGQLERERAGRGNEQPAVLNLRQAREQWIRAIKAVRAVLDLVDARSPVIEQILRRIDTLERRADLRRSSGGGAEAPAQDLAGAPAGLADAPAGDGMAPAPAGHSEMPAGGGVAEPALSNID